MGAGTDIHATLVMIAKMTAVTLLYVCLNFFVWRKFRGRKLNMPEKCLVGCLYGVMAILSTHFGVEYSGSMVLNVRDLGPLSAGLFFDPVSGVIAGLIGGIERYVAGKFWGVGAFTTVACSVATCMAGLSAAFLNVYIFKGKRPSGFSAFSMGAVIEVFHMYSVFVTNRDNMREAFNVVRTVAVPMILFSGLGLMLSSVVIKAESGEWRDPFKRLPSREVPLSQKFRTWLFIVTTVVLASNFFFNYTVQTSVAYQLAKDDLLIASEDIDETYYMFRSGDEGSLGNMVTHIGNGGKYFIISKSGTQIEGSVDNCEDELMPLIRKYEDNEMFEAELFGETYLCRMDMMENGAKLITMEPTETVYKARDAHCYETLLADVLLFTILYVLISMLVQAIVVDKLQLVNRSLNKITDGDLDEEVSVYDSSEFASLSQDINQTVGVLKGYIDEARKSIEQDLLLARTIQDSALPKNFDFKHEGFDIYATMDPAKEVGGDFYDFFFVDADKIALVIADVAGKGIPASLFMMRSKTAIRGMAETGTRPSRVLERINEELCRSNDVNMFVTVWMGIVDLRTGGITCVNAGHEYPVIKRGNGGFELYKDKHCPPVGVMEDVKYKEYELHIDAGDKLFVYTDGVPEAINTEEEQYGTDRMLRVLDINSMVEMKRLLPAVKRDIDRFAKDAEQFDDITMMGFKYFGMEG